jgi:hypothetical protein
VYSLPTWALLWITSRLLNAPIVVQGMAPARPAAADAAAIANDNTSELLLNPRARTGELLPLNLATEPALAELINAVDLAELTATP